MHASIRSVLVFTCAAVVPLMGCVGDEPKEAAVSVSSVASPLADGRAFMTGYFNMNLDGIDCGLIQKVEGGNASAEVVVEGRNTAYLTKRHIGNVKYNDFSLQMGAPAAGPITDWIRASLDMNYERKSGEITARHFKADVRQIREFRDGLLTEIGLPATDAGEKDPAYVSVKFSVGSVIERAEPFTPAEAGAPAAAPALSPSRVRVTLAGTELPGVTGLDAIAIKLASSASSPQTTVSDLVVRLPATGAWDLQRWLAESRVQGQATPRDAIVEYFADDNSTVAVRLLLSGVVIAALAPGGSSVTNDEARPWVVTMHVGSARLGALNACTPPGCPTGMSFDLPSCSCITTVGGLGSEHGG